MYKEKVIRVVDLLDPRGPQRGYYDEPVLCDRDISDAEHEALIAEVLRQRMNEMGRSDPENFRVFVVAIGPARTFDEVMKGVVS